MTDALTVTPRGYDSRLERAEAVAKAFHEAYERLAPTFEYETRRASAVPWESVPLMNKRLVIAVAEEVIGLWERGEFDA